MSAMLGQLDRKVGPDHAGGADVEGHASICMKNTLRKIAVRVDTSILVRMFFRYHRTVSGLTSSVMAISLSVLPAARAVITEISRGER